LERQRSRYLSQHDELSHSRTLLTYHHLISLDPKSFTLKSHIKEEPYDRLLREIYFHKCIIGNVLRLIQ